VCPSPRHGQGAGPEVGIQTSQDDEGHNGDEDQVHGELRIRTKDGEHMFATIIAQMFCRCKPHCD
jgi:hypothetical protein